jgi:hypothetical protein
MNFLIYIIEKKNYKIEKGKLVSKLVKKKSKRGDRSYRENMQHVIKE